MKPLLISAVLFTAVASSSTTASASHPSYCYTGPCLHVDGERHMISALQAMDDLVAAPCARTRAHASIVVQRELGRAAREVASTDAKLLVLKSQQFVDHFTRTGHVLFLDSAAQLVKQAIATEQLAHQRRHASDRYRASRLPMVNGVSLPAPFGFPFGNASGYNSFRFPASGYGHGFGYQPATRLDYGVRYRSSYPGGGVSVRPGCEVVPSAGISLRIGR